MFRKTPRRDHHRSQYGRGRQLGPNRAPRFEMLEERRLLAGGAKVITHLPRVLEAEAESLSSIHVSFDRTILGSTFGPEDVVLKAPDGQRIEQLSVQSLNGQNDRQFDVTFPTQYARGVYRLQIGPLVRDTAGNWMDQNGDQANAQGLQDAYFSRTTFRAAAAKVTSAGAEAFRETFDDWAAAPSHWSIETQGMGTVAATSEGGPRGSGGHLVSTASNATGEVQAATLVADLSAQASVGDLALLFWAKRVSGESQSLRIDLSGDGEDWHELWPAALAEEYTEYAIDVQRAAEQHRIALDGDVFFRFRHVASARDQQLALDDVRFFAGDLFGPFVVAHSPGPAVSAPGPLQEFFVTFDEAVDAGTLDASDALLGDPDGRPVAALTAMVVPGSGNMRVQIQFPPQFASGDYRLKIGPNVKDLAGNPMNQDKDGRMGEVEDAYFATVSYRPTSPTCPGHTFYIETNTPSPSAAATCSYTFTVTPEMIFTPSGPIAASQNLTGIIGRLPGSDRWDTNVAQAVELALRIPGDFNGDGAVDQGDLDLVLLHWGRHVDAPPEGWIANPPRGAIDQDELDAVLLNWGRRTVIENPTTTIRIPPLVDAVRFTVGIRFEELITVSETFTVEVLRSGVFAADGKITWIVNRGEVLLPGSGGGGGGGGGWRYIVIWI